MRPRSCSTVYAFPMQDERCGGLPIPACFASDIRVVSDTLKCFNMLGLYMSKDSGVNPTFHVATKTTHHQCPSEGSELELSYCKT